jgi:transposase InsO family protein
MCELLGVSESGYWAWCKRPPSDRELTDAWLIERIRAIHSASGGRYGSPRVHAMLRREGIRVGEKRVERLMRLAGLQGAHRRRRKGCTIRVPGVEPFADLVGWNFRPAAPNLVWAADIKQIRTGEGWLYLAAVQDLFSRRIVGWSMAAHMRQELVVDALTMAVKARKPAKGTIHHSDHGNSHYDNDHLTLRNRGRSSSSRPGPQVATKRKPRPGAAEFRFDPTASWDLASRWTAAFGFRAQSGAGDQWSGRRVPARKQVRLWERSLSVAERSCGASNQHDPAVAASPP